MHDGFMHVAMVMTTEPYQSIGTYPINIVTHTTWSVSTFLDIFLLIGSVQRSSLWQYASIHPGLVSIFSRNIPLFRPLNQKVFLFTGTYRAILSSIVASPVMCYFSVKWLCRIALYILLLRLLLVLTIFLMVHPCILFIPSYGTVCELCNMCIHMCIIMKAGPGAMAYLPGGMWHMSP